jgi:hypothetical protein
MSKEGVVALQLVLAVPGRRYAKFEEVLQDFKAKASKAEQELIEELPWQVCGWWWRTTRTGQRANADAQ